MKDFEGYYLPDFDKLWDEATFVFDTNVWLDLYRFSQETSEDLFDILEQLKGDGRIWIPYQFAYEYHENLMSIYDKIDNEYNEREKDLEKQREDLKRILNRLKNRHGFEVESYVAKAQKVYEEIIQNFEAFVKDHKCRLHGKPLLKDRIAQLIEGNYGKNYPDSCKEKIRAAGENRDIPPTSSKDKKKDTSDPYGDLIGWFQILDYAEENSKPIILITDDKDWFHEHKGKTKPHPRMVQEMYDKADVSFYLYKTGIFMKRARDYLKSHVSDETIEEVTNRGKYTTQQKSPTASLVQHRLYMMHEALRSIQQNVDIIHEELELIQPLDRSMRDALHPMQSLDTPKMHEALRSIQQDVDVMREELPLIRSLPLFMYEVLRSIQQDVDMMREELRSIQLLNPSIIRIVLRSIQQSVDIVREEMLRIQHGYPWTTSHFDETTSP